jgi:hypothetical protein
MAVLELYSWLEARLAWAPTSQWPGEIPVYLLWRWPSGLIKTSK